MQKVLELLRRNELYPKYQRLIASKKQENLLLLNYTPECQYGHGWDEVTLRCRGLIIDTENWSVAALPFCKFFNLEEERLRSGSLPRTSFMVFEKLDGSLGITFRDRTGHPLLATRGSFTSEQASRGSEMLRKIPGIETMPKEYTPLFEIIYHQNKSVVKYNFEGLVLLGIMNRMTGEELPWSEVVRYAEQWEVQLPKVYSFGTVEEAVSHVKLLPTNTEGFVIRFANGLRVKLKGDAYLELHRLIWNVSERHVLEMLEAGKFEELQHSVPEEFRVEIEALAKPIVAEAKRLEVLATESFSCAPRKTRKEFALWIQENAPAEIHGALFNLFDQRIPNWYKLMRR